MAILPGFKALLNKNLSDERCREIVKEIRKTQGVLSAAFNKTTREVKVTHEKGSHVKSKIANMAGVRTTKPLN